MQGLPWGGDFPQFYVLKNSSMRNGVSFTWLGNWNVENLVSVTDVFCWHVLFSSFSFFKIKFIGVTLVNKIISVPSVQFYYTSSVYYTACLLPNLFSNWNQKHTMHINNAFLLMLTFIFILGNFRFLISNFKNLFFWTSF